MELFAKSGLLARIIREHKRVERLEGVMSSLVQFASARIGNDPGEQCSEALQVARAALEMSTHGKFSMAVHVAASEKTDDEPSPFVQDMLRAAVEGKACPAVGAALATEDAARAHLRQGIPNASFYFDDVTGDRGFFGSVATSPAAQFAQAAIFAGFQVWARLNDEGGNALWQMRQIPGALPDGSDFTMEFLGEEPAISMCELAVLAKNSPELVQEWLVIAHQYRGGRMPVAKALNSAH